MARGGQWRGGPRRPPEAGLFLTGDQDQQRRSQGGGGSAHFTAPRLTHQLLAGAEPPPSPPPLAPELGLGTPLAGGQPPGETGPPAATAVPPLPGPQVVLATVTATGPRAGEGPVPSPHADGLCREERAPGLAPLDSRQGQLWERVRPSLAGSPSPELTACRAAPAPLLWEPNCRAGARPLPRGRGQRGLKKPVGFERPPRHVAHVFGTDFQF